MSVVTGRPDTSLARFRILRPDSIPEPRYALRLVRLALSNEALKTICTGSSRAVAASCSAMRSVKVSFSMTHGPAITRSFSPLPQRYGPTCAGLFGTWQMVYNYQRMWLNDGVA